MYEHNIPTTYLLYSLCGMFFLPDVPHCSSMWHDTQDISPLLSHKLHTEWLSLSQLPPGHKYKIFGNRTVSSKSSKEILTIHVNTNTWMFSELPPGFSSMKLWKKLTCSTDNNTQGQARSSNSNTIQDKVRK